MSRSQQVGSLEVVRSGRFPRVVRLRDEWYEFVDDPGAFLSALRQAGPLRGDLFTFVQEVPDAEPRHAYACEVDEVAVVPLTDYETWWRKQVNDKTRNMIRKCQRSGVEFRPVAFDDALVEGIHRIYNETPMRQGRRFRHFGKDRATLRAEHATFLDRSEFVGAFLKDELIGFIKLVHGRGIANLMNIIALVGQRDKAPTNGLIAEAVARCCQAGIPRLMYGSWSRRSMGDFKRHHAFACVQVPRYYVPLTLRGRVALALGLHRPWESRLPEGWEDRLVALRNRWNTRRTAAPAPVRPPARVEPAATPAPLVGAPVGAELTRSGK